MRETHAPELVETETLAAIRGWLARGWISTETAARAVREIGELALVRHRHAALRPRIWALLDRCSPYDSCYVALAESLARDSSPPTCASAEPLLSTAEK